MKHHEKQFSLLSIIPNLYYVLFFIVPLVMSSSTSEIFEFNKMISIYLITIIIATVYLFHSVIRREKIILSFMYIPLLLFLLSQILSTLFSIDVHTSIFGYYGRWNGGLVSIISYITLFYIGAQSLNFSHVKRLLMVSLITSGLVILWGLPGKFGHDLSCYTFTGKFINTCWTNDFNPAERMFSTLGQPNWLGAYLAIHFFIACYFLFAEIKNSNSVKGFFMQFFQKNTSLYSFYLAVNLLVIWFTKSRSALLAVLAGVSIGILFVLKEFIPVNEKIKKNIYWVLGILVAIGIIWSIRSGSVTNLFTLPTEASAISDSFDIRKVVWKGAIDLGNKYPVFGSGVETFAYAYYFTRPAQHNLTSEWDFIYNKAHNEYLNYFATTGYFGLISYLFYILAFFILCFYSFFRQEDKNKRILTASVMLSFTTILITNFFGFSVSSVQIFFYLLPIAVIVINREEILHESYSMRHVTQLGAVTKIMTLFILLFGLSGIYYIYNYYSADILYAQARINMENNEYAEAYGKLSQALKKRYEHIYEDKLSNTAANLAFLDSFTEKKTLVSDLIAISKTLNDHTLQISKNNILYYRTKGKNYYLYYQTTHSESDLQKAVEAMEYAVKIAKTDVQSKYTLALFYYIASQEIADKNVSADYLNKTKRTIEEIIRMKPNYIEAQELYTEILNKE